MMRQSIEAWIYHPEDGEILLLKVEDEPVSFWQPVTGGIESGESPEEACLREIKRGDWLGLTSFKPDESWRFNSKD